MYQAYTCMYQAYTCMHQTLYIHVCTKHYTYMYVPSIIHTCMYQALYIHVCTKHYTYTYVPSIIHTCMYQALYILSLHVPSIIHTCLDDPGLFTHHVSVWWPRKAPVWHPHLVAVQRHASAGHHRPAHPEVSVLRCSSDRSFCQIMSLELFPRCR